MLCSTQRMGIRFCLNDNGVLIDSKESNDLIGQCRVCSKIVQREKSFQLFQHSDKQCEHLVLSEICERLTYLISHQQRLAIPIDYTCTNSISVDVAHCSLLIDTDTRPLIELTLQDNQALYLTIALEDSEVDQNQIQALRKRFDSVIELNLSDLAVPSTDFTSYLSDKVLDDQFHKRCTWLSFNPLHSLTRNIASIEQSSIENEQQRALSELEKVNERIKVANHTLEQINSDIVTTQTTLTHYHNQKHKYDLSKNIEDLKRQESELFKKISTLKRQRSELLSGNTTSRLSDKVEELRAAYSLGKQHIKQQEFEKNSLERQIERLTNQKSEFDKEIDNAKWLRRVLEKFDCSFGDLEQELMQIVELSESYDQYQNKSRLAQNKLNELEANVNKKQEELDEVKKGVEFYKAQKFKLFKENQGLKKLVESGDV
ncbi:TPA: hypothetical protein N2742_000123 [Vibrio parahaemolyticus]|nr:hypothetical protein [Vibrio parahaemolyticus]ELA8201697.1 hypothetical protein [Vibrio parahaemolyticus]ELA9578800.1 hypothetical protein [Vibrio parahaemolyticus]KJR19978.1 hypothetical protein UF29_12935 [Vibrio parahaemolyticus]HCE1548556.1 hypothetical protein [Vibrio parahaemolyticus]